MKGIKPLVIVVFPFFVFLLEGCYTQLAVAQRIYVEQEPIYESFEDGFSQYESSEDTLVDELPPEAIVHEYHHYWPDHRYDPWCYYDPFFDFRFTWGDPYWDPWHWRYRRYWSRFSYSRWYWDDFFWYDPYWGYAYSPSYYWGYYNYPGYGSPGWGWYWPQYAVDPQPKKKRDWDRRGGGLTDETIVRPSSATEQQSASTVHGQVPLVAWGERTPSDSRTVKRRGSESSVDDGSISRRVATRKVSRPRGKTDLDIRRTESGRKGTKTVIRKKIKRVKRRSDSANSRSRYGKYVSPGRSSGRSSGTVRTRISSSSSRSSGRSSSRSVSRGSSRSSSSSSARSSSRGSRSSGSKSSSSRSRNK